ncbi:hypothetical protein BMH30_08025, partial [Leucobacter sp. OLES1]
MARQRLGVEALDRRPDREKEPRWRCLGSCTATDARSRTTRSSSRRNDSAGSRRSASARSTWSPCSARRSSCPCSPG